MSRLYDVLEHIIEKVNKSVKFEEAQALSDTEKQIALTNLGLSNLAPSAEPKKALILFLLTLHLPLLQMLIYQELKLFIEKLQMVLLQFPDVIMKMDKFIQIKNKWIM